MFYVKAIADRQRMDVIIDQALSHDEFRQLIRDI